MAELHVQRKRHGQFWLWLILIIILFFVAGLFIYSHYNRSGTAMKASPTSWQRTHFSKTKNLYDV